MSTLGQRSPYRYLGERLGADKLVKRALKEGRDVTRFSYDVQVEALKRSCQKIERRLQKASLVHDYLRIRKLSGLLSNQLARLDHVTSLLAEKQALEPISVPQARVILDLQAVKASNARKHRRFSHQMVNSGPKMFRFGDDHKEISK